MACLRLRWALGVPTSARPRMKYEPVKAAIKRWLSKYGWALDHYPKDRCFAEGFRAGWKAHQQQMHKRRDAAHGEPK